MAVPCAAEYPDMNGKRRGRARLEMLDREIGFLQEELKSVESLQVASTFCKENKKNHRSSRSCLCFSQIGCCCCCAAKCCHDPLINNPCECDCCKCIRFRNLSSCNCQLPPSCCSKFRPKVRLCCSCRGISCDSCARCRPCF